MNNKRNLLKNNTKMNCDKIKADIAINALINGLNR